MTNRRIAAIVVLPILVAVLTGCTSSAQEPSTSDEPQIAENVITVSAECAEAIATLAPLWNADLDAGNPAITDSTQECATTAEYFAAAHAATDWDGMYQNSDDWRDNALMLSACEENITQPACVDAQEQGIIN